jgi:hypothetical protein
MKLKNIPPALVKRAMDIRLGQFLTHNEQGKVEVLGIQPHCGDFMIVTPTTWVYLSNCKDDE